MACSWSKYLDEEKIWDIYCIITHVFSISKIQYPHRGYVRALFYKYYFYFCYLILAPNSFVWYQKITLALVYLGTGDAFGPFYYPF